MYTECGPRCVAAHPSSGEAAEVYTMYYIYSGRTYPIHYMYPGEVYPMHHTYTNRGPPCVAGRSFNGETSWCLIYALRAYM